MVHYQEPDWFTRHVANPLVSFATRMGLSLRGSRVLAVRGRKSGEWRRTPVNPVEVAGARYLVAPRGHTQWVRNIRAAGGGILRAGRTREAITVEEVPDEAKVPILREYLRRWKMETGTFFDVSGPDAPDDDLRRIAPDHPVFRITAARGPGTGG
jgi:deazaflavin-dependent oxidoreductase (nitroreductase family)